MPATPSWTQIPGEPGSAIRSSAKVRSSETVLRSRIMILFSIVGIAALAGPLALVLTLVRPQVVPDYSKALPHGLGVAQAAAEQYVKGLCFSVPLTVDVPANAAVKSETAGDGCPVTTVGLETVKSSEPLRFDGASQGMVLGWDGFYTGQMALGADTTKTEQVEFHRFIVTDLDQAGTNGSSTQELYWLVVPVVIPFQGSPALAAVPSLLAGPSSVTLHSQYKDPTEFFSEGIRTSIKGKVLKWAKAYAESNQADLKDVTGTDVGKSYFYPGLSSAFDGSPVTVQDGTSQSPQSSLVTVVQPADETVKMIGALRRADGFVVIRVRACFKHSGTHSYLQTSDYDLLVSDADSGSNAHIQAWGGSGTGLYLTPFANAIIVKQG